MTDEQRRKAEAEAERRRRQRQNDDDDTVMATVAIVEMVDAIIDMTSDSSSFD